MQLFFFFKLNLFLKSLLELQGRAPENKHSGLDTHVALGGPTPSCFTWSKQFDPLPFKSQQNTNICYQIKSVWIIKYYLN